MSTGLRRPLRVWLTGDHRGLLELRMGLETLPELAVFGGPEPLREVGTALTAKHADAILHGVRDTSQLAAEVATIREHSQAPIVVLAPNGSAALVDEALAVDAADVVVLPQPEAVLFALRKAVQVARGAGEVSQRARLVVVFSPKGGTGKSVVATNLATALASSGERTLLVDLDLQFGDSAIMLGLEPAKTLLDLVGASADLDAEKLAGYATQHPSGLHVLPAPLRPEGAELVTDARVTQILDVASGCYDVVVVDTPPLFDASILASIDRTDELLLVAAPDVPTLKNVRLTLQTLELLSFPSERIRLVLNRSNEKIGVTGLEVAAVLDRVVDFELPDDQAVLVAINRGEPAVLSARESAFAQALRALEAGLFGRASRPPARRSRFAMGRS